MAGMEGLGRIYNVVPIAAGVGISLKHCSGITFVCTNSAINAVFTVTVAPTFAGTYVAPTSSGGIISHYYQSTSQNGSTGFTKVSQTAANAVTQATSGDTTVIEIFGSMLPDPNAYIKLSNSGGAGLVQAILHDLTYQRGPANLVAPGA